MTPPPVEPPIAERQARLKTALAEAKLEFLLVTHLSNLLYLTGFHGSAGMAIFGRQDAALFVDPRYTLEARDQARGVEVRECRKSLLEAAGTWFRRRRAASAGFDDANLSYSAWNALRGYAGGRCRLRSAGGLVEKLRMAKDAYELTQISRAARLTSKVFNEVRELVRPGVAEADLAAEIEYRAKRQGADGMAFESIVASGPRSALPHARPSAKLLKKNEFVIFDLGVIMSAYAADMTRTVYLGKPDARARRIYQAVLEAERAGIQAARAGVPAGLVDRAARRVLARRTLSHYFSHSTGHGVGLEIHEAPRVARNEKRRLESGFVITVEPGVYLDGYGGVRIEDTVAIGEAGPDVLTTSPREDWVIA